AHHSSDGEGAREAVQQGGHQGSRTSRSLSVARYVLGPDAFGYPQELLPDLFDGQAEVDDGVIPLVVLPLTVVFADQAAGQTIGVRFCLLGRLVLESLQVR